MKTNPTSTPIKSPGGDNATRLTHESFGVIKLSHITGGGQLFGSDIQHPSRIKIEVHRAYLDRHLNRDWIHDDGLIVSLEMSHSQFAQFITTPNNYSGAPVTLRYAPAAGSKLTQMPGIDSLESKGDLMRKEVEQAARSAVASLSEQVTLLGEKLASGKIGIKELKEIQRTLEIQIGNLAPNMAYTVKSAQESIEKAKTDALIEIETYTAAVAHRLGLDSIQQLPSLAKS